MSPPKAPNGKRGFMASMLVWAILIAAGLLGGGYMIAANTGEAQTDVNAVERIARQNAALIRENDQRIDEITRLTRESQKTTKAVCELRADLKRRVTTSREFLREHPRGIPGISAKTIRDGIRNQRRTIRALGDLSC